MPLGKLSQKQLLQAYSVLKDALELVQREDKEGVKGPNSRSKYIELSNRFFTLVPHDFGVDTPPLLNTEDLIKVCLCCQSSLSPIFNWIVFVPLLTFIIYFGY